MSIITTPSSTISMNDVRDALDVAIDSTGSDGFGGTKFDGNRLGHTNYTTATSSRSLPISFNDNLVRRLANSGGIAKVNSISMRDMTRQKGPGPYSSSDGQTAAYCSGSTLKVTLNNGKYDTYNADKSNYSGCAFKVYVLVVGGGAAGGAGRTDQSGGGGGGGGGGGIYQNSFTMTGGDFPFTINVGAGGQPDYTSGPGGGGEATTGYSGGSSALSTSLGTTLTVTGGSGGSWPNGGAGGTGGTSTGGAGGAGVDDVAPYNAGGDGAKWTVNGLYYGGGGGGGGDYGGNSSGGAGGGGLGSSAAQGSAGTNGLGGGGGGGGSFGGDSWSSALAGGSGCVIVAYAISNGKRLSGGTESSDSSYYYHTYTTVGGNQKLAHV